VTLALDGKVAVVTGGSGVLGRTYSKALVEAGAAVAVIDLVADEVANAESELTSRGAKAIGVVADVSDDESVEAAIEYANDRLGGINILVNNAGLLRNQYNLCSELSTAEWNRIMSVNVIGALICARACRRSMITCGGGVIINQSSMGAYASLNSAYSVSKLALSALTVALATEFAPDAIRVNGIAPGMMTGKLPEELVASVLSQQMLQRRGTAEDLIGALLFLCSSASSFVTGQTIIVDGGVTRRP
jgi:3-oxoacyl-[acyl-carrier protein] reductase